MFNKEVKKWDYKTKLKNAWKRENRLKKKGNSKVSLLTDICYLCWVSWNKTKNVKKTKTMIKDKVKNENAKIKLTMHEKGKAKREWMLKKI